MLNHIRNASEIVQKNPLEAKVDLPSSRTEKNVDVIQAAEQENNCQKKHCLVLDLDETLIHVTYQRIMEYDFVVKVKLDDDFTREVCVKKRPRVNEFLQRMAEFYELVVFTSSIEEQANPILDVLDTQRLISKRLFRQNCSRSVKSLRRSVKDLSTLNWPLSHILIIDNNPKSYVLHPTNAVPILSWSDDPYDAELMDMAPFLEKLTQVDDVRSVLDGSKPWRIAYKKLQEIIDKEIEIKNEIDFTTSKQQDKKSQIAWLLTKFGRSIGIIKQEVSDKPVDENSLRL